QARPPAHPGHDRRPDCAKRRTVTLRPGFPTVRCPMRLAVLPFALLLLLPAAVAAQTNPPLTLEQVMADPDWIGPPVEQAWWSWDGKQVQYQVKREGATIKDTWRQPVAGGSAQKVDGAARAELDAANPAFDAARTRMAFVRNGNLVFRVGNDWFRWRAGAGVSQAAVVKAEKDPAAAPKADDLRDRQMHMIRTLQDDKARRDAARVQDEQWRRDDATRAPLPAYLGNDVAIVD